MPLIESPPPDYPNRRLNFDSTPQQNTVTDQNVLAAVASAAVEAANVANEAAKKAAAAETSTTAGVITRSLVKFATSYRRQEQQHGPIHEASRDIYNQHKYNQVVQTVRT